jgi:hypothetical protein
LTLKRLLPRYAHYDILQWNQVKKDLKLGIYQ